MAYCCCLIYPLFYIFIRIRIIFDAIVNTKRVDYENTESKQNYLFSATCLTATLYIPDQAMAHYPTLPLRGKKGSKPNIIS